MTYDIKDIYLASIKLFFVFTENKAFQCNAVRQISFCGYFFGGTKTEMCAHSTLCHHVLTFWYYKLIQI